MVSRLRPMTTRLLAAVAAVTALIFAMPAIAQQGGAAAEPPAAETTETEAGGDAGAGGEADSRYEMPATGEAEAPSGGQLSRAAQERTVPGGTLLIVAYLVLWVLVVGFVAVVLRQQRRLDAELDGLERRIDDIAGVDRD